MHEDKHYPHGELKFLEECLLLLVDCRYTLKWTYAYAYYCINDKSNIQSTKKQLFEHTQTDLENYTQRLHTLVMIDKSRFLDPNEIDKSPFYKWRSNLVNLQEVLIKYKQAVIDDIEKDPDNSWFILYPRTY